MFALRDRNPISRALVDLHLIVWKFTLIALTRRDLFNERFHPPSVWTSALARYARNVHAMEFAARSKVRKWIAQGKCLPAPIRHLRRALYPLASLGRYGELYWSSQMREAFRRSNRTVHIQLYVQRVRPRPCCRARVGSSPHTGCKFTTSDESRRAPPPESGTMQVGVHAMYKGFVCRVVSGRARCAR